MVDLGRTIKEMYPTASDAKNKKHYDRMALPKSVMGDKKLSLDDVHKFHIKGKIVGHNPDSKEVHIEMLEGECLGCEDKESGEGETMLGKS